MSVVLSEETFARLVGHRERSGYRTALFEVSEEFLEAIDQDWSGLVQFKLVRTEGELVEWVLRRV